jgi:hypothetical protein
VVWERGGTRVGRRLRFRRALPCCQILGWEAEKTRLGFACRWTKLRGRKLVAWANPAVTVTSFGESHDDEATTFVELSLDTPPVAIAPYVDQAVQGLFVLFGGYRIPLEAIEHWVRRLIQRQL